MESETSDYNKKRKISTSSTDMAAVYVNAMVRALNEPNPYVSYENLTSEALNRMFVLYWLRQAFNNENVNPRIVGWMTRPFFDFEYNGAEFRLVFTPNEAILVNRENAATRGVPFQNLSLVNDVNGITCNAEMRQRLNQLLEALTLCFYSDLLSPIERGTSPKMSITYHRVPDCA